MWNVDVFGTPVYRPIGKQIWSDSVPITQTKMVFNMFRRKYSIYECLLLSVKMKQDIKQHWIFILNLCAPSHNGNKFSNFTVKTKKIRNMLLVEA